MLAFGELCLQGLLLLLQRGNNVEAVLYLRPFEGPKTKRLEGLHCGIL